VISKIGRALTILALCLSIGFQWVALQSVAWATMLLANARSAPLCEAMARTFDGGHPCSLCHVVAEGKKSEKKSEILPALGKVDLICTQQKFTCLPPWARYDYAPWQGAIPEHTHTPPAPPPRLLPG
jgi:hypothetical protein